MQEMSQKFQEIFDDFNRLHNWLLTIGEGFLLSQRDMGTTLPTAHEFVEIHKRLKGEIEAKQGDFEALNRKIQSVAGEPEFREWAEKTRDLLQRWDLVRRAVDGRIPLGTTYEQFHKSAAQVKRNSIFCNQTWTDVHFI